MQKPGWGYILKDLYTNYYLPALLRTSDAKMYYLRTREDFFVLHLTVMDWEDEMEMVVQPFREMGQSHLELVHRRG
jgi:hypothetical protein